jgi:hypothetical protein
MNAPRRSNSVALMFGAVMTAFLFTFADVSCQGQRVASLSGAQLAFGTQVAKSDMWGNKREDKVRAEPLALLALVAAVAGLGLALIGPAARRWTTFVGGAGALLLMILISKLERDATLQSSGMLDVSPGLGLLAAIGLFVVAAVIAWFTGRDRRT